MVNAFFVLDSTNVWVFYPTKVKQAIHPGTLFFGFIPGFGSITLSSTTERMELFPGETGEDQWVRHLG